MEKHVLSHVTKSKLVSQFSTVGDATSAAAVLPFLEDMLARLQAARASLWESSWQCKQLAKPTQSSSCGWQSVRDSEGQKHSIARADLYCETIEWQYNEMGASDEFMSKCPNAPVRNDAQQKVWEAAQATHMAHDQLNDPNLAKEVAEQDPDTIVPEA